MFIVIEGQDATGKDTQADRLKEYFESRGKNVIRYSESGTGSDNEFISTIAKLNYGKKSDIEDLTRVLLYIVNRYEQWQKFAAPALKNGDVVIIARNWLSTLIYSGYLSGVSRSLITKLHKLIMPEQYFHPDKIILLTINEDEQARRLGIQADGKRTNEVWKSQGRPFQRRLNQAYLEVAKKFDVSVVDASDTIDEVTSAILRELHLEDGSNFLGAMAAASAANTVSEEEPEPMFGKISQTSA